MGILQQSTLSMNRLQVANRIWGFPIITGAFVESNSFFWLRILIGSLVIADIVNSKLGMPRSQIGQSISQQGFFSSRDSLSIPCVSQPLHSYSATTSDMDLSRKNDNNKAKKMKPGEQPLLGSWNPSSAAPRDSMAHPTTASVSTNHLTSNNDNAANSNNLDR